MRREFTVDEIFEMAGQIERNGARFYRSLARRAGSGERAELLNRLAAMEDEHERTFAGLRERAAAEQGHPAFHDPDGQAALYLRALTAGHVFDRAGDEPGDDASLEEVLRTAVQLEKDSIVFYVGLAQAVPEALGRDHIDRILREEMEHVVTLQGQIEALRGGA